jgi:ribosomal protein S18 acetylase RimI-like enzyme|tara:strand:+ start:209 stop:661 length:453 start_codon:yes stop_codon:yes gene_type:complete
MKVTIGFRKAKKEDIDFLLLLRKKSMNKQLKKAGIVMNSSEHLARVEEFFYDSHMILRNRKAIGLLKLGLKTHSLHIRQFQILPEFQSKGIGTLVINVVKKRALQLCLPITLNVLVNNPARALYLRHGFQIKNQNKFEYQMFCPLEVVSA